MLKISNLKKYYKHNKGIENINLNINKGEIFGFIGPNGAGKSTTIRCIMNMINKNLGEIFIDNKLDLKENSFLKEEIGYLPGEVHLYDDYTVKEMIKYSASFYKKDCSKKSKDLVERLKINTSKKISELSLGNLKKLGIILALIHDPKFIILDEPTSGLDPLMQEEFYNIILEEKKAGKTIFLSSHNLNEIKKICDRVAIIKDGSIVEINAINDLLASSFVIVTIISKDINKIKSDLKIEIINEKENILNFTYHNDINELIKIINKYKIDKILIQEPSLEEIFIHFYK